MSCEYCLHWRYAKWVHLLAKVKWPPMPSSLTRNVLWDICDRRWRELHSGAASVSQVSKDRFNTEPVEIYRLAECVSIVVPCSVWSHVAMIQLSGIPILAENQRLLVIPLVQLRKKNITEQGKDLRDDHTEDFLEKSCLIIATWTNQIILELLIPFSTYPLSVFYSPDIMLGVWIRWRIGQIPFSLKIHCIGNK